MRSKTTLCGPSRRSGRATPAKLFLRAALAACRGVEESLRPAFSPSCVRPAQALPCGETMSQVVFIVRVATLAGMPTVTVGLPQSPGRQADKRVSPVIEGELRCEETRSVSSALPGARDDGRALALRGTGG